MTCIEIDAVAVLPKALNVAKTVAFPGLSAVSRPPLMVTTWFSSDVHVVHEVTSRVRWSLKVAMAVSCWVVPTR